MSTAQDQKRGHPIIFWVAILLLLALLVYLGWQDKRMTVGVEEKHEFVIKEFAIWLGYSSLLFLGLFLFVLIIDRVFKGGLAARLAPVISLFFPGFGGRLAKLSDYYKPSKPGANQNLKDRSPFSMWMIEEITPRYENILQGWAYVGAGVLIAVIGLRAIGVITKGEPTPILLALLIELSILGVLGLVTIFKLATSGVERETGLTYDRERLKALESQFESYAQELDRHQEELKKIQQSIDAIRTRST